MQGQGYQWYPRTLLDKYPFLGSCGAPPTVAGYTIIRKWPAEEMISRIFFYFRGVVPSWKTFCDEAAGPGCGLLHSDGDDPFSVMVGLAWLCWFQASEVKHHSVALLPPGSTMY
jgi:hypothetical protein